MTAMATAPAFDAIALGTDIQRRLGVKTSRDEPLARFTTMRVGGPADLFATAHNTFELPNAVQPAAFGGATVKGDTLEVKLPAKAVVVLALK